MLTETWRERRKEVIQRMRQNPAQCVLCTIMPRNSMGVKVLRYPLLRRVNRGGKQTSVCIGSIGLCDRCILENAELNEKVWT